MKSRLEKFEAMLQEIEENYQTTCGTMNKLFSQSKTRTVTYQQLKARKYTMEKMLAMYRDYDLLNEQGKEKV